MKNKAKVTKFPVARIKRIMQKDEDVGKVAQATPVVISKALEMFLSIVVEEASKVTLQRGAKRVEAYHLKHAIETVDMLDFLKELTESVPDPSAGGTVSMHPESGDSGGEGGPPKRKRAPRRKTITDGDEDEDDEASEKPKKPRARRKKAAEGEDVAVVPKRARAAPGIGKGKGRAKKVEQEGNVEVPAVPGMMTAEAARARLMGHPAASFPPQQDVTMDDTEGQDDEENQSEPEPDGGGGYYERQDDAYEYDED